MLLTSLNATPAGVIQFQKTKPILLGRVRKKNRCVCYRLALAPISPDKIWILEGIIRLWGFLSMGFVSVLDENGGLIGI